MPKVAPWRLVILAIFGKNRQRAGDNGAKSGPLKLDYKRRPYNCEATLLKERSNYILNKRPL